MMKSSLASVVIFILLTQCAIDRTILTINEEELQVLASFKAFRPENQVQLCDANEPGQPLWLCLTLISKDDKKPLINQQLKLYQTSASGQYEPSSPNDESTARLSGEVVTNAQGQVFVQTILPGDYGSSSDNRHIHTTVPDARPEAYDIHFKQYTGYMGKNFISGSDQHFLADLKQNADDVLVAFVTIEVKNPQVSND